MPAAHAGKRRARLRLRRHAAAEGFAAGNQRQLRHGARRRGDGGADGRVREMRRIGPSCAALHRGKLIAQRGDAALAKLRRDRRQERMMHSRAGAMGEHVARPRPRRRLQQAGDGHAFLAGNGDRLGNGRGQGCTPNGRANGLSKFSAGFFASQAYSRGALPAARGFHCRRIRANFVRHRTEEPDVP